jgi:hypothetical protein
MKRGQQESSNHLAAANRRFRFPFGGFLKSGRSVFARSPRTAPVAERGCSPTGLLSAAPPGLRKGGPAASGNSRPPSS